MNKIISKHHRNENIVGFCFNQVSTDAVGLFEKFKSTTLVKKMNLYSNKPGQVTKGGWHTKILNVKKDTNPVTGSRKARKQKDVTWS